MEMREEDQPPEAIWLNDQALSEHFERVNERYADKGGGGGSSSGDWESIPDLDQNEMTKGIRGD